MPNHTTNILVLEGPEKEISRFRELTIKTDESGELNFDFNAIVPMHEDLSIECTPIGDTAYAIHYEKTGWQKHAENFNLKTKKEVIEYMKEKNGPDWDKLGHQYASNIEKYGHRNWYDWSCANWGTKWGAYDTEIEDDNSDRLVIQFQTAWSPPIPIYKKIVELFPELSVEAYWSDEGSYEREKVFSN